MDGQDRRASLQLGRQARKEAASPYARPASPANRAANVATPSRLSGLLSYLSPFRRGKKREPSPEPEVDAQPDDDEQDDHNDDVQESKPFALHGEGLAHAEEAFLEDHDMDANAPPSPTPYQSIYPNLASSMTASKSMPQLASISATTTPRVPGRFSAFPRSSIRNGLDQATPAPVASWGRAESVAGSERSPPGRANEELARFFREKADRGDEPLTAIEQAGVLHLMQQVQAENLPTAFTPSFRPASPAPSAQPFYARQDSVRPIPTSASSNSVFDGITGTPGTPGAVGSTAGHTPYRRRRPIYVGAGYSSRSARRHQPVTESGLPRSQSEGSFLNSLGASSPVAEGKRRRVETDEDAPPVASTSTYAPLANTHPSPAPQVAKPEPSIFSAAKLSANAVSTPIRPSPLWQVSQANTPSPSPPKKTLAASPAVARPATRAADMMMDIIRQEDEARPKTAARNAVLNPYESADHNALARIPRSRPSRPVTPKRPQSARVAAKAANAAPAKKEVSQLERLERTMPAEYKRDDGKRAKATSTAEPSPAPTQKKTQMAVVPTSSGLAFKAPPVNKAPVSNPFAALSSGHDGEDDEDDDEEEDYEVEVEDEDGDYEEEEEEEDDDDDDDIIIEEIKKPEPKAKSKATAPAPAPAPAPTSAFTFGSAKPTASISSFPSFGVPASKASEASASPVVPTATVPVAPKPLFSFAPTPTPAVPTTIAKTTSPVSDSEARQQALETIKSSLPNFAFAGTWNACSGRGEADEPTRRVTQELVRNMGKGELPAFEF